MPAAPSKQPQILRFVEDGRIPNSRLPLVVMREVVPGGGADVAADFERLFARHGWTGAWRNGIFGYHHFHSTSHEVLGCARGWAQVRFGGAGGDTLHLAAGDVVVIPAGVGHKRERAGDDLLVVGAYPDGRDWDVRRGDPAERAEVMANLAAVPLPAQDPVHGAGGPLLRAWSG